MRPSIVPFPSACNDTRGKQVLISSNFRRYILDALLRSFLLDVFFLREWFENGTCFKTRRRFYLNVLKKDKQKLFPNVALRIDLSASSSTVGTVQSARIMKNGFDVATSNHNKI